MDHRFPVKGVGTVALGTVTQGVVRKHDALSNLPGGEETVVRSIQRHGRGVDHALQGERVGLALKGLGPQELDRGRCSPPST